MFFVTETRHLRSERRNYSSESVTDASTSTPRADYFGHIRGDNSSVGHLGATLSSDYYTSAGSCRNVITQYKDSRKLQAAGQSSGNTRSYYRSSSSNYSVDCYQEKHSANQRRLQRCNPETYKENLPYWEYESSSVPKTESVPIRYSESRVSSRDSSPGCSSSGFVDTGGSRKRHRSDDTCIRPRGRTEHRVRNRHRSSPSGNKHYIQSDSRPVSEVEGRSHWTQSQRRSPAFSNSPLKSQVRSGPISNQPLTPSKNKSPLYSNAPLDGSCTVSSDQSLIQSGRHFTRAQSQTQSTGNTSERVFLGRKSSAFSNTQVDSRFNQYWSQSSPRQFSAYSETALSSRDKVDGLNHLPQTGRQSSRTESEKQCLSYSDTFRPNQHLTQSSSGRQIPAYPKPLLDSWDKRRAPNQNLTPTGRQSPRALSERQPTTYSGTRLDSRDNFSSNQQLTQSSRQYPSLFSKTLLDSGGKARVPSSQHLTQTDIQSSRTQSDRQSSVFLNDRNNFTSNQHLNEPFSARHSYIDRSLDTKDSAPSGQHLPQIQRQSPGILSRRQPPAYSSTTFDGESKSRHPSNQNLVPLGRQTPCITSGRQFPHYPDNSLDSRRSHGTDYSGSLTQSGIQSSQYSDTLRRNSGAESGYYQTRFRKNYTDFTDPSYENKYNSGGHWTQSGQQLPNFWGRRENQSGINSPDHLYTSPETRQSGEYSDICPETAKYPDYSYTQSETRKSSSYSYTPPESRQFLGYSSETKDNWSLGQHSDQWTIPSERKTYSCADSQSRHLEHQSRWDKKYSPCRNILGTVVKGGGSGVPQSDSSWGHYISSKLRQHHPKPSKLDSNESYCYKDHYQGNRPAKNIIFEYRKGQKRTQPVQGHFQEERKPGQQISTRNSKNSEIETDTGNERFESRHSRQLSASEKEPNLFLGHKSSGSSAKAFGTSDSFSKAKFKISSSSGSRNRSSVVIGKSVLVPETDRVEVKSTKRNTHGKESNKKVDVNNNTNVNQLSWQTSNSKATEVSVATVICPTADVPDKLKKSDTQDVLLGIGRTQDKGEQGSVRRAKQPDTGRSSSSFKPKGGSEHPVQKKQQKFAGQEYKASQSIRGLSSARKRSATETKGETERHSAGKNKEEGFSPQIPLTVKISRSNTRTVEEKRKDSRKNNTLHKEDKTQEKTLFGKKVSTPDFKDQSNRKAVKRPFSFITTWEESRKEVPSCKSLKQISRSKNDSLAKDSSEDSELGKFTGVSSDQTGSEDLQSDSVEPTDNISNSSQRSKFRPIRKLVHGRIVTGVSRISFSSRSRYQPTVARGGRMASPSWNVNPGGSSTFGQVTSTAFGQSSGTFGQTNFGQTAGSSSQTGSIFGQSSTSQSPSVFGQTSSMFGQTTGAAGQSSSIFGQAPESTGQTPSIFGQSSGTTGQNPSMFGQTSGTTGQAPSTFGQTSGTTGMTSSIFGQTSGTTGQTSSRFGQTSGTTGQTFGTQQPVTSGFGQPTGSQSTPVFGQPTQQPSSTGIFGQQTQTGPMFGQPSSSGMFGQGVSQQQQGSLVFGGIQQGTFGQTARSSPVFGGTGSNTPGNVFGTGTGTATTTSRSIFSIGPPATTSVGFGGLTATTSASSSIGSQPSQTTASMFGGAGQMNTFSNVFRRGSPSSSVFGAAGQDVVGGMSSSSQSVTTSSSIFGTGAGPIFGTGSQPFGTGVQPSTTGSSVFGQTGDMSGSIFGRSGQTQITSSSIFGRSTPPSSSIAPSIFGGGQTQMSTTSGGFAAVPSSTVPSIFGGFVQTTGNTVPPATTTASVFSHVSQQGTSSTNMFGKTTSSASVFGGVSQTTASTTTVKREPSDMVGFIKKEPKDEQTQDIPPVGLFGKPSDTSVGALVKEEKGLFGKPSNTGVGAAVKQEKSLFGKPSDGQIKQESSLFGKPDSCRSSSSENQSRRGLFGKTSSFGDSDTGKSQSSKTLFGKNSSSSRSSGDQSASSQNQSSRNLFGKSSASSSSSGNQSVFGKFSSSTTEDQSQKSLFGKPSAPKDDSSNSSEASSVKARLGLFGKGSGKDDEPRKKSLFGKPAVESSARRRSSEEDKPGRSSLRRLSSATEDISNRKVIVCKNVPKKFNYATMLRKHFSKYGEVAKVFPNTSQEKATIHFKTHEGAAEAKRRGRILVKGQPPLAIYWGAHGASTRASPQDTEKKTAISTEELRERRSRAVKRPSESESESSSSSRGAKRWQQGDDVQEELAVMSGTQDISLVPEHRVKSEDQSASPSRGGEGRVRIHRSPSPVASTSSAPSEMVKTEKVSLSGFQGSVCRTTTEKAQILAMQDKYIRQNESKGQKLMTGTDGFQGMCPDMCPERERYDREDKRRLHVFEMLPGTENIPGKNPQVDHSRAVKEYIRPSPDQPEPLPHELRPVPVLQRTMTYILSEIADRGEDGKWGDWFDFLWNRTRGIRKDITQQQLCNRHVVELIEKCTRFHIFCSERLCEEDMHSFDDKINNENLTKCLQTLKEFYHDLEIKQKIFCPNEAEFRAYFVLMNLNEGDTLREVQQLRPEVRNTQTIDFALKVYSALNSNNYIRFFRLVKEASFLNACILHRYFTQVRQRALVRMMRGYSMGSKPAQIPISELIRTLGFEDHDEAQYFCEYYGFKVDDGDVYLDRTAYIEPEIAWDSKRAVNLIESKRMVSVGEVISGEALPPFQLEIPDSSFDSSGRFRSRLQLPAKAPEVTVKTSVKSQEVAFGATREVVPPQNVPTTVQPPVPTRPKLQYTNETVKEMAKILFWEVIDEMSNSLGNEVVANVKILLDFGNAMATQFLTEAADSLTKETCTEVYSQEQAIRYKAEMEAREAMRDRVAASLTDVVVGELVIQESLNMATIEVREIRAQQKKERIERCSLEENSNIVDSVVCEMCNEIAENIYQTDVVERLEELNELERCVKMSRKARFLQRWKKEYKAVIKLKKSMLAFPSATSMASQREQIRNFVKERRMEGIVEHGFYVNKRARLTVEQPMEILDVWQNVNILLTAHDMYKKLLHDRAWAPFDMVRLVGQKLVDVFRRKKGDKTSDILWKVALCVPDPTIVRTPEQRMSSHLSTWIKAKFTKGQKPSTGGHLKSEVLSLYRVPLPARHPVVKPRLLGVCCRTLEGNLDERELQEISEERTLLGTCGIVYVMHVMDSNQRQKYWAREDERFRCVMDSRPEVPQIPIVVVAPTGPNGEVDEEDIWNHLPLEECLEKGLVSAVHIVMVPCDVSLAKGMDVTDPQLSEKLCVAVQWLAEKTEPVASLKVAYLKDQLEVFLLENYYTPVLQNLKHRKDLGYLHKDIQSYLDLYNSCIQRLFECVCAYELQFLSWPIPEFVRHSSLSALPPAHWNSEDHREYLEQLLKSLVLPEFLPQGNIADTWESVCAEVWNYVKQIVEDKYGSARVNLITRVELLLKNAKEAFEETCFLLEGEDNCQPLYANVPWADLVALCIDYKITSTDFMDPDLEETESDELRVAWNKDEPNYYVPREWRGTEPEIVIKESAALNETLSFAAEEVRTKAEEERLRNRTEYTIIPDDENQSENTMAAKGTSHSLFNELKYERRRSEHFEQYLKSVLKEGDLECMDTTEMASSGMIVKDISYIRKGESRLRDERHGLSQDGLPDEVAEFQNQLNSSLSEPTTMESMEKLQFELGASRRESDAFEKRLLQLMHS